MADNCDTTKCQYIGNLAAIYSDEYDRIVGIHSPWAPNLISPLNKVFVGNACIYEVVRVLDTISIVVKRPPINVEILEKDLDSIYEYCMNDLEKIAEKHQKFMQKSPVKFYIYSPEQKVGGYKFLQIPVEESVFNEKFLTTMFECNFSVIFNDMGKFERYQPEQNMIYNIYNKPHSVFNDYSRYIQTPNYESNVQKGFVPPIQSWQPPFGQAQPPPFGQAQPPPFGQAQPPPFGQAQPPPFGQAQPPPFGQAQPPPFGLQQPPAQPPPFGLQQPPAQPPSWQQVANNYNWNQPQNPPAPSIFKPKPPCFQPQNPFSQFAPSKK